MKNQRYSKEDNRKSKKLNENQRKQQKIKETQRKYWA